jgi:hypothetical protein
MGYAEHAARCLETLKAYLADHPAVKGADDGRRPKQAAPGNRRSVATQ